MEPLLSVMGELIRVPEGMVQRRRLLVSQPKRSEEHIPARLVDLTTASCLVDAGRRLDQLRGRLWLRFPGHEPFQLAGAAEEDGLLRCWFSQQLQTQVARSIVNGATPRAAQTAVRARCTFL